MDEPLRFILFALAAAAFLLAVAKACWRRLRFRLRRTPPRPPRAAGRPHLTLVSSAPQPAAPLPPEVAEQLRQVTAAPFRARPLLSGPAARILRGAEAAIAQRGLPWRVMAQVRLAEILASPSARAFAAIAAKRVDLLLIDAAGRPLAAIAWQGAGRCLGNVAARDAVKKEALRRAGVGWIELANEHRLDDLARQIDRVAASVGVARAHRPSEAPAAPASE